MSFILSHIFIESIVYITIAVTVATPFLMANIRVAPNFGLLDWPKARGISEEQIPIIGSSIVLLTIVVMSIVGHYYGGISSWFLISAFCMGILGFFDDKKPVPAVEKLFWQLVFSLIVIFCDPVIYSTIVEAYGAVGTVLALFFMLGLVNAINFIDGIDGLAGSMIVIGALAIIAFSRNLESFYSYFILSSILVGILIPFLYFNLSRKAFLGNTGSYFLGFVLAYLHLSVPMISENIFSKVSISGLCFVVPIADAIVVVLTRTLTVRSPFMADKGHLHHRMVQTSIALRYVIMNFGLIALGGLAIAVSLNEVQAMTNSLAPLVICASQVAITGILILLMEKASKRRVQSYIERMDKGDPIYYLKYQVASTGKQPLTYSKLKKLEALVSAEIRVTDICFTVGPNELYIVLKTFHEPIRFMTGRITPIFEREGIAALPVSETGEYVKVTHSESAAQTPPLEKPALKKAL